MFQNKTIQITASTSTSTHHESKITTINKIIGQKLTEPEISTSTGINAASNNRTSKEQKTTQPQVPTAMTS